MALRIKERLSLAHRLLIFCCVVTPTMVHGQAIPTATKQIGISTFGAATGVYTGLNGGRNLSFTAGADFSFKPIFSLYPSLEVRGTLPLDKGKVDSQKNILTGLKLSPYYGRFHPYGNLLFGRGQINYGAGLPTPDHRLFYIQSYSNVLSPGAGLDVRLNDRFDLKFDCQFQRYNTPVSNTGHIWAKSLSLGAAYHFSFGKRH